MIAIGIIVASGLVVLALVAGAMLERERRRRRVQRDRELAAERKRERERERLEASRVAVKAALTELQAAGEDWRYAQIEHDWRVYVYAGRVRALALAASRVADPLHNGARL